MATRETLRNIDETIQKNATQTKKSIVKKQVIKNIQNDVKYFLLDEFKQEMRNNSSNYYIILQGFNKKNELKQTIFDSFKIDGIIKHKKEIATFFDDNYLKLLNKAKKEIQAEELSQFYQEMEILENEEKQNINKIDKINSILKIILIIIGLPIIFIGCLFYGVMKNCK